MPQEQLFERRRPALERRHPTRDEPLEHALQLARLDLLDDVLAVGRVGLDRDPRQVAQLGQRTASRPCGRSG